MTIMTKEVESLGISKLQFQMAMSCLCKLFCKEVWQDVYFKKERNDVLTIRTTGTTSEVLARLKLDSKEGTVQGIRIRTDLLAKYQADFYRYFPGITLTFDRLRPYLVP